MYDVNKAGTKPFLFTLSTYYFLKKVNNKKRVFVSKEILKDLGH